MSAPRDAALAALLEAFPGKSVLIVGDVMLDEYVWGEVHRISPEAPVPVVELRQQTHVPGGAANVAANVASLGGRPLLGGVVGEDAAARLLRDALSRYGVDGEGLVVDPDRTTTTKLRVVAHGQQVVRVDREERRPISPRTEETLLGWAREHLEAADALLLSDYAKGVVTGRLAEQVILMARAAGKPVVVDPKGRDYRRYRGATVVTPNVQEARQALSHLVDPPPDDLQDTGQQLLALLEGVAVLITRGPEGMSLFEAGRKPVHIPATARQVYDVTGSGDTVAATLSLALAAGVDLERAARLANAAAGIVVSKVGTATVDRGELLTDIAGSAVPSEGVPV